MMHEFGSLFELAADEKWNLFVGTFLLLMSTMISMSLPFGLGQIVDIIQQKDSLQKTMDNLNTICFSILAISVVKAICTLMQHYVVRTAGDRITTKIRTEAFSAMLKQEIGFFDKNKTGELINRLSDDTARISYCVTSNISDGIKSLFTAIAGVLMMFSESRELTYIGLSVVPPFAIVSIAFGYFLKKVRIELQNSLAESTQVAEERISNIRTVRAFCQEEKEAKLYEGKLAEVLNIGSQEAMLYSVFYALAGLGNSIIVITVLYYGGQMISNDSITIGTLSAFLLYAAYVGLSLHGLSEFYSRLMTGVGAYSRLYELINRTPIVPLNGGDIPTINIAANLRFHSVSFSYPSRADTPVLNCVNLDIPAGSVLAVVGPSGSGKSTLVSLLLRFYDPTSGVIKLDGMDIARLDPEWLRQQIGTVTQEPALFSGTIKDNILYGSLNPEGITDRRVYQVAKEANALEFILRFKDQFETKVGERGIMLSGGQRQRIAIARALIKNPKILLFDEATSALDAESEHLVQEALERVAKNRTVIIIAHRLSTIRKADKIAVVVDGRFAEVGTFEDLMTIPYGKFRKLVEKQTIKSTNIEEDP